MITSVKRVLLVTTYFPPVQSVASERMKAFAVYLTEAGFSVSVLCTEPLNVESKSALSEVDVIPVIDDAFIRPLKLSRSEYSFFRFCKVVFNKIFFVYFGLDYFIWKKRALAKARELVSSGEVDIVISSFAPMAAHEVGLAIKDEFPYIAWVVDMRDEFPQSSGLFGAGLRRYKKMKARVLERCDLLTSVSEPILRSLNSKYKCRAMLEINNGFDFELTNKKGLNTSVFSIGYAGSFYGYIHPRNFLEALAIAYQEGHFSEAVEVRFIGVKKKIKVPDVIADKVFFEEPRCYDMAVEFMKQSDALLLVLPRCSRKGVYSGKLFDYLASLTPIIAVVDKDDVAARLIKDCNGGYLADSESIDEIKAAIIKAYSDWKSGCSPTPNIDLIKTLHRRNQVNKLAEYLHSHFG